MIEVTCRNPDCPPPSRMVPGGPRERAQIFREALRQGRTVSVGYRKGGMLEVRDMTGCQVWWLESGWWYVPGGGPGWRAETTGQRFFLPSGTVVLA